MHHSTVPKPGSSMGNTPRREGVLKLESLKKLVLKPGRGMIEWKNCLNTINNLYFSLTKNTLQTYQRINYKKGKEVYFVLLP